jgi:hypothetical protein
VDGCDVGDPSAGDHGCSAGDHACSAGAALGSTSNVSYLNN